MTAGLTPRQAEILAFVKAFRVDRQMPPTRAEIAEHFGFRSPNAVQEQLVNMETKGALRLLKGTARGIFVL